MIDLKKFAVVSIVASSALVLSACNLYRGQTGQTATSQEQTQASPGKQGEIGETITYSESGFSPNQVKIKVGESVEFKNNATKTVQINSVPHPTHELYPDLNIGTIPPGQSKSATFAKAGTYQYHNHLNASQGGAIIVE